MIYDTQRKVFVEQQGNNRIGYSFVAKRKLTKIVKISIIILLFLSLSLIFIGCEQKEVGFYSPYYLEKYNLQSFIYKQNILFK